MKGSESVFSTPSKSAGIIHLRTGAANISEAAAALHRLHLTLDHSAVIAHTRRLRNANDRLLIQLAEASVADNLAGTGKMDLYRVGMALNTVVGHIETAAVIAYIHDLKILPDTTTELLDIILSCAYLTASTLPSIGDAYPPDQLRDEFLGMAGKAEEIVGARVDSATPGRGDSQSGVDDLNEQLLTVVHAFYTVGHTADRLGARLRS